MSRLPLALVLVPLALAAVPAAEAPTVFDRNVAYISGLLAGHDPDSEAVFADGRTMSLREAIALTAARAGGLELGVTQTAGVAGHSVAVGDIWVFEHGRGPCAVETYARGLSPRDVAGALRIYEGSIGKMTTTHGFQTDIWDWTTGNWLGGTYFGTRGVTIVGQSDFHCFFANGEHVMFPYIDGVVVKNW